MKCQGRVAWRGRALCAGLVCLEQKVPSPEWVPCSCPQGEGLSWAPGWHRGLALSEGSPWLVAGWLRQPGLTLQFCIWAEEKGSPRGPGIHPTQQLQTQGPFAQFGQGKVGSQCLCYPAQVIPSSLSCLFLICCVSDKL